MSTGKIVKLYQIVRLRQIVKKWQKIANMEKSLTTRGFSLSPRRRGFLYLRDSDEGKNCKSSSSPPRDVPQGHLAVYAGKERKRFIIRTRYLSHPLFRALLQKAEEEFGFDHQGGLTIPCEAVAFEHLLWLLGKNDPTVQTLDFHELLDFYYTEMQDFGAEANMIGSRHCKLEMSPLLRRTAPQKSCG